MSGRISFRCWTFEVECSMFNRLILSHVAVFGGESSPLCGLHEINELLDFRDHRQFGLDLVEGCLDCVGPTEKNLVEILESPDCFIRESVSLETYEVNTLDRAVPAVSDHERWQVNGDCGTSAEDGEPTDPTELVYRGDARNETVVSDFDISGGERAVGHNDVVADSAIVRYVRVCHHEAVVSYDSFGIRFSPDICGEALSEDVAIADLEIGNSSRLISMILRVAS